VVLNGALVFSADDGVNGRELWRSDGTEAGTVQVADIRAGALNGFPDAMAVAGSIVLLSADNGSIGREVWKSDGTAAGTMLVKDINLGAGSGFPQFGVSAILNLNGSIYFVADDGANGTELWKSDGTESGTVRVKDIRAGPDRHPRRC
jgi:trimeric autotransporter adhesin